ncbi:MAG: DNA-protecting protein DprA [Erysipelotrichia bacterium]|nr:DNA-protecting protein DprA [Erysipelotrichia bacterium]NCC54236.1 DNA-protecting protein DprA [Erysipelotrichia bacterium]
MRERILYYALKYDGDFRKISNALLHDEPFKKCQYEGHFITLVDQCYPRCLLQLRFKPWILFYEGDLSLLEKEMIAVVGSRNASEYGKACTYELIHYMKERYGVVSGLAKGIDGYAHQLALLEKRSTIAVVGCGIDVAYPKENEALYKQIAKEGLIISEYPNGSKPYAHHFPWRNRIIAALGKALVVIEAKKRSGTLISVNEALELGKDIYCFPHHYFDENGQGCNSLILQGCAILSGREDIQEI